jgi:uncharacterized protein YprB with RNaseH-like and TPR domain
MEESLRTRLEALNRGPLPAIKTIATRAAADANCVTPAARRPASQRPRSRSADERPAGACPVGGLLRSGDVVVTPHGPHLRIELPLESVWPGGVTLIAARQRFLREQLVSAEQAIEPALVIDAEFAKFIAALPDRALALDLETCGLAGAALFLVGLLWQKNGGPTVELLLARNYSEEPAVLWTLWRIVAEHDVLLSFNGKSFDWPMVVERSVRHRLEPAASVKWALPATGLVFDSGMVGNAQPTKVHIDILHHARRRWRSWLPDCRLQTLERHVCRRTREADIPGHAIPAVYADFVRSGFERDMDRVLYHNALDLVTLVDLAHRLAMWRLIEKVQPETGPSAPAPD